jgi:rhombotail lipoprotein
MHRFSLQVFLLITFLTQSMGCAFSPRESHSQDLAKLISPAKDSVILNDKKALALPAAVAVLMVPGNNKSMIPDSTLRIAAEELKKDLLKNTRYISGVSIVSNEDIQKTVSLETLRDLYGTDIIVILSYQQDQRRKQSSIASLLNFTIIPAFLVPSVKLTTATVIEGKIIHIPSNAVIFRSSGVDERAANLTLVDAESNHANEESIKSIVAAVKAFGESANTKIAQLDRFDFMNTISFNKILSDKTSSQSLSNSTSPQTANTPVDHWKKVDQFKQTGGGSFGILELVMVGFIMLIRFRRKI